MGHVIDFTIYWNKEDLLIFQNNTVQDSAIYELRKINSIIEIIIQDQIDKAQYQDLIYQLSLSLSLFIQNYYSEINIANRLQLQVLFLLAKIKNSSLFLQAETVKVIEALSCYLQKFSLNRIPYQKIHDLLVYETYHFFGLIPHLNGQKKLNVNKVKNIELYSFLLSKYKKPQIQQEYLEIFFNLHRKELLIDLVDQQKKIAHIHYDADFLENFMTHKIILELTDQDINVYLNRLIQHEFIK